MRKVLHVEIYGHLYEIYSQVAPAYLEQLARIVDGKMRALSRQTDTFDTRRLAVLAALNLADELQQLKQEQAAERVALPREFATRLEHCNQELASVLGQASGG